ncbi:MAG: DUF6799 domain-containing protein [Ferruginibacter sp.]
MKKLLLVASIATIFAACDDSNITSVTTVSIDTTSTAIAPTEKNFTDGDMMMKDGKMMIIKGGIPKEMTQSVTLSGEVRMKDGTTSILTEGAMIHGNGGMMDNERNILRAIDQAGDKMQQGADKLKEGAVNLKEGAANLLDRAGNKMKEGAENMKKRP